MEAAALFGTSRFRNGRCQSEGSSGRDQDTDSQCVAAWRMLSDDEVRARAAAVPGELRGYLTVVPESRWVKHPAHGPHFEEELLDHYADHEADLRAILGAVG